MKLEFAQFEFKNEPQRYWGDCPRHSNGGLPPDYDRDEVAIGLMNDLVAKGYDVELQSDLGWSVEIWDDPEDNYLVKSWNKPTIAAAIKGAIKMLLER